MKTHATSGTVWWVWMKYVPAFLQFHFMLRVLRICEALCDVSGYTVHFVRLPIFYFVLYDSECFLSLPWGDTISRNMYHPF